MAADADDEFASETNALDRMDGFTSLDENRGIGSASSR
jgi:hypothetical protein